MRNANIRSRNSYSRQSSSNNIIWIILAAAVVLFLGFKFFASPSNNTKNLDTTHAMSVTPGEKSLVSIGGKNISEQQNLFTDEVAIVEQWNAIGTIGAARLDIDEKTEFTNISSAENGNKIKLEKGRIWIDGASSAELKRLTVTVPTGGIAMIEQTNTAFSVVYAIQGISEISTSIWKYSLSPGEGIKLSDNNLANSQTKREDIIDSIDASVLSNVVFTRNNGEEVLKQATTTQSTPEETNTTSTSSGATTETNNSTNEYISFTQPLDGSTVKTQTINILGTLSSTEVARVTINDIDTAVSPSNASFSLQDVKLTGEINNLVYKVYDRNNTRLAMGVLVVYWPKSASAQTTIIPENYPISDKDFKITAPATNPYTTTESYVQVRGTVPKGMVKYITVNDYRLQKFVPNSETWYYHANGNIGTMKDGTNLYYIKFFDNNDKLLSTQLFTIIKDTKVTPVTPTNNATILD